jgi:TRAP-type C4-dicarboxylate transport system permease small subunit
VAFAWALFELANIAWPREYVVAPGAPWWQLYAVPLVLGSILGITTLHILINNNRQEDEKDDSKSIAADVKQV